jgi:predicted DNA-binding transcriptional regulator AlpA
MESQAADRLLSSQELADYFSVPLNTVYVWRARGTGPPGIKVGRFTRYRMSEVDAWLDERIKESRRSA